MTKISVLMLVVLALVLVSHIVSLATALWLAWPISGFTLDKAAALGSSFGVLSTLFSGLAFWGLIWTILIQRDEIRRQRVEAKRERISQILLDEASRCLTDLNTVQFHVKVSTVFPADKPFGQWAFFYNAGRLMQALADKQITNRVLIEELAAVVAENIQALSYFYERLDDACDVARYLLADSEVSPAELNEIKVLFFSRFSDDIFLTSSCMKTILQALLDRARGDEDKGKINPLQSVLWKIGSINEFRDQEVDELSVRSWRQLLGKEVPQAAPGETSR